MYTSHVQRLQYCEAHGFLKYASPTHIKPECENFLNIPWEYLHVYKAGGTTIQSVFGGVVPCNTTNHTKVFATVRDPISHFLSGYHEAMMRLSEGQYMNRNNPYNSRHVLYKLSMNNNISKLDRMRQALFYSSTHIERPRSYAEYHYDPSVSTLTNDNHKIMENLESIIEVNELNQLFPNAILTHSRKSKHIPQFYINASTLSAHDLFSICDYMILDYCCLNYDLPYNCRGMYALKHRSLKKNSSVLWNCAMHK